MLYRPLGQTLNKPLKELCRWAEDHFHEVEEARARERIASGSER